MYAVLVIYLFCISMQHSSVVTSKLDGERTLSQIYTRTYIYMGTGCPNKENYYHTNT